MLARHKIPFLAIDGDPALVARERKRGTPIFYGDATRIELLRSVRHRHVPAPSS